MPLGVSRRSIASNALTSLSLRPRSALSKPGILQLGSKSKPIYSPLSLSSLQLHYRAAHGLKRNFHSTHTARKGLTPDSSDPTPPNPQSSRIAAGGAINVAEPSPLTDTQYHDYSEHYFNVLMMELERVQEEGSETEAEYSVC
jgi:frataxin